MRSRALLALCAFASVVAAASAAEAQGVAVHGAESAVIELPEGLEIETYRNNGYALHVEGRLARVEVTVTPLGSTVPFVAPPAARRQQARSRDPVASLARALTSGSATRHEAVSRILGWVSRNVQYRLDRGQPQGPEAVLARRSAYCTGFARLTVALLRSVGIEAREVPGLVAGASGGEPELHRWVEVYYPDRGWVFSDPRASHHHVAAAYVRLAGERVEASRLGAARLLRRGGGLFVIDAYLQAAPGVRARKNGTRQLSGVVRVKAPDVAATSAKAVLIGHGEERSLDLTGGVGTFVGVEPGSYRVRVTAEGVESLEGSFVLERRARSAVNLRRRGR